MQLSRQESNGVQWKLGNRSIWSFYFPGDEWEIYAEIALTRSPVVPPPPPPPSCLVPSPSALLQLLRRTATHLEANRPAVPAPARAASAWRLATIAPLLSRNGRRRNNGRRWGTDAGALSAGGAAASGMGPGSRVLPHFRALPPSSVPRSCLSFKIDILNLKDYKHELIVS